MSDETKRKRPRGTGSIFSVPGSRNRWVGYTGANGEYIRESCGSAKKEDAKNFLRRRMEAVSGGNFLGPRIEKITADELFEDLLQHYRTHGYCVSWPAGCWEGVRGEDGAYVRKGRTYLKDYFGGMKASRVGTDQIAGYVEKRQGEGASKSTINRELSLLRRAFSLGFDAEPQKVSRIPKFHKFIVSEKDCVRRGFAEESDYRKLAELAREPWLRALLALAYTYGFRKSELLGMRCSQVDLLNDTVCLYSGETKNDEGRLVRLTKECRELVVELRKGKQPEDYLFTRENGKPVRDLRRTWDTLVKAAGLSGLLLHDFRRSAVRTMVRRGIPERVAMGISGHKTRSVFDRYNIVSEADLADAVRKIEAGAARNSEIIHSEPETQSEKREENARKPV